MAELPRVDMVIDLRSSWGKGQRDRFVWLAKHLDQGGWWVALRTAPEQGKRERLAERLEVSEGPVVWQQTRQYMLKVRDRQAVELLSTREVDLDVSVLHALSEGVLHRTSPVVDYDPPPHASLPNEIPYPAAHLRRYDGTVRLYRGAAAVHGRSVLPESFRWHLSSHPANHGLLDVDARFARVPVHEAAEVERLSGPFFFLDYANPGHYGHLMTEAISNLWGWQLARQQIPELRLLLRRHHQRQIPLAQRPESSILSAWGLTPDDVAYVDGIVEVETLVGTTPLWHNHTPHYAHPALRETWATLRDHLIPQATPGAPMAERIFVSRREGNRTCHNAAEVERLFADAGYHVVLPGALSMAQQAAVFAGARVVAGFGGTGMFNLAFADRLEAVVVLNHRAYDARNEALFAALLDVEMHTFWSEPDIPMPDDEFSYAARQSSWTFDLARHSEVLTSTLTRLG